MEHIKEDKKQNPQSVEMRASEDIKTCSNNNTVFQIKNQHDGAYSQLSVEGLYHSFQKKSRLVMPDMPDFKKQISWYKTRSRYTPSQACARFEFASNSVAQKAIHLGGQA